MLTINCEEHLAATRKYAAERGIEEKLEEQLAYLANYADGTCNCLLYSDFAPYSFYFELIGPNGQMWFNGGCIYYEDNETGAGSPQLSLRLGEDLKEGWSIHT